MENEAKKLLASIRTHQAEINRDLQKLTERSPEISDILKQIEEHQAESAELLAVIRDDGVLNSGSM